MPVGGGKLINRHTCGTTGLREPQRAMFILCDRNCAIFALAMPVSRFAAKGDIALDPRMGLQLPHAISSGLAR